MDKIKVIGNVKMILTLLLASVLRAFAMVVLMAPNNMTIGGIIGVTFLINVLTDGFIPMGLAVIALNIPIIAVSYFTVGRKFALKTSLCVGSLGLIMWLFESINLYQILGATETSNKLLYCLIAGALFGVSLALSFSVQASTGGTDVLGVVLERKLHLSNVPRLIMMLDIVTIMIVGIVMNDFDVFMFSFVGVFVSEIAVEYILRGFSRNTVLEIVTSKPQEVIEELNKLNNTVAAIKVKGMYSNIERVLVTCVVPNRLTATAKKVVREVDAASFTYLLSVKEVIGTNTADN